MAQALTIYLSQDYNAYCPPPELDETVTYRIRLYSTTIICIAALAFNCAFISMANALHRRHVYANITVTLILVACIDICWSALSLIEVAHDLLHILYFGGIDLLYYVTIVLQYTKAASVGLTNATTYLLLFALLEMTIGALCSFCAQHKQSCCCCATAKTRVPTLMLIALLAFAVIVDHFWSLRSIFNRAALDDRVRCNQNRSVVLMHNYQHATQPLLPQVAEVDWRELQLILVVAVPVLAFLVLLSIFTLVKAIWAVIRCCEYRKRRQTYRDLKRTITDETNTSTSPLIASTTMTRHHRPPDDTRESTPFIRNPHFTIIFHLLCIVVILLVPLVLSHGPFWGWAHHYTFNDHRSVDTIFESLQQVRVDTAHIDVTIVQYWLHFGLLLLPLLRPVVNICLLLACCRMCLCCCCTTDCACGRRRRRAQIDSSSRLADVKLHDDQFLFRKITPSGQNIHQSRMVESQVV